MTSKPFEVDVLYLVLQVVLGTTAWRVTSVVSQQAQDTLC